MTITITNTTKLIECDGVQCRVWEGKTDKGVPVACLIPRITAMTQVGDELADFEQDLIEKKPPSAEVQAWPLRLIL